MTSVRAAGFSSNLRRSTAFGKFSVDFSAINHSTAELGSIDVTAPPLEQKPEDSPETQMQEMEKRVTVFQFSCENIFKGSDLETKLWGHRGRVVLKCANKGSLGVLLKSR